MKTFAAVLLLLPLVLVACGRVEARRVEREAVSTAPATAATASGCGSTLAAGSSVQSVTSGGKQRSYRLYVPASYDASKQTPLVLNFHGFGGNARQQEAYAQMPAESERSGFIVATPDGSENPQRWYIYQQREQGYDSDMQFVRDLVAHVGSLACIDAKRVYSTGMSNGAAMSSRLGCELDDVIAAIAPVAGAAQPVPSCRGGAAMPVIAFHGTDDSLVPFEGGPSGRMQLPSRGVHESVRQWAQHNGCSQKPAEERVATDVLLETYGACRDGAVVQVYIVEGGGHAWPGAEREGRNGSTTQSIDATQLMWQFFAAHPKP